MSSVPDSTAVRTALWRALHVLIDAEPHVLDDTLGLQLADPGDDWRERGDMHPQRTTTNRASIVARARAAEDLLADSGAGQYVVLGAGLDTFAQRHAAATDVHVFEVDAPATQQWKQQRLAELGLANPDWLHFVPVDFEAGGSWPEALAGAGLDPGVPTVVSMLGVTMYLTRDANLATMRAAAKLMPGSALVFSYSRPIDAAPPEIRPILEGAARGAAGSGHPWLSLWTPDEAVEAASQAGFGDVRLVTSFDLHDRYFADRPDGLSPAGGEDLIVATVR